MKIFRKFHFFPWNRQIWPFLSVFDLFWGVFGDFASKKPKIRIFRDFPWKNIIFWLKIGPKNRPFLAIVENFFHSGQKRSIFWPILGQKIVFFHWKSLKIRILGFSTRKPRKTPKNRPKTYKNGKIWRFHGKKVEFFEYLWFSLPQKRLFLAIFKNTFSSKAQW